MSRSLTPTHATPTGVPTQRGTALAVLCAALFIINVDSTVVIIALPARYRQRLRLALFLATAQQSFFDGFQAGCLVAAGVLFAGAIFAATFLPARPTAHDAASTTGDNDPVARDDTLRQPVDPISPQPKETP